MRVVTAGWRNIRQIGTEVLATRLAVVLRVGNVQFLGASRYQVAHIVQGSQEHPLARCRFLATRTGALNLIALFFENFGFGQVFDAGERHIGPILAGSHFG